MKSSSCRILAAGCLVLSIVIGYPVQADDRGFVPPVVPLFDGLGVHGRLVTTSSAKAQRYFDQGLSFLFAFNHDEAIRAFQAAANIDPDCAMAWWGVALANGPHINNPVMTPEYITAAWQALQRARSAPHASAVERGLIDALTSRYADPQPQDRQSLDAAYAKSMRTLWRTYPDDGDIGALFAESLMDLRPWDLWTSAGKPQAGTPEILATLERVMRKHPQHPLALHLYIHAIEASPYPEKGDMAAETLRNLEPALGHMVHMPSHIDVRRGRWAEAIAANEKAIEADRRYRQQVPEQGFYRIYMAHNHQMLSFAAMMSGRSAEALREIDAMVSEIPAEVSKEMAPIFDGVLAMPLETRVRFGRWEEILAAAEPPEYFPVWRALRHAARGVAYVATDRLDLAKTELALFASAKSAVSKEAIVGNNSAAAVLAIAGLVLEGELAFRSNQPDAAFRALRQAVTAEDTLRYNEPPDWVQPTRHALGAVLLKSGRSSEAERVFRADLRRYPDNGWALFGLAQSLRQQRRGKAAVDVEARLAKVWEHADIPLTTPCLCQPALPNDSSSRRTRAGGGPSPKNQTQRVQSLPPAL